jgi:KTSC domain
MSFRQNVFSSMIDEVAYDDERQVLSVQFKKSGAVWEYAGITEEQAWSLANAPSVGSMFLSDIKPFYTGTRVS